LHRRIGSRVGIELQIGENGKFHVLLAINSC
jgi:hypothetical protein